YTENRIRISQRFCSITQQNRTDVRRNIPHATILRVRLPQCNQTLVPILTMGGTGTSPRRQTVIVASITKITSSSKLDWATSIQGFGMPVRSEEHTSELQSRENLVC